MLHRLTRRAVRTTRRIKQRIEAGRREMALDDVLAYRADTWTSADWMRMLRYSARLHRIAHGRPPFRAQSIDF